MSGDKKVPFKLKLATHRLLDEDGNVESVLVIIPLLILFLGVLQIGSATLIHGDSLNRLQGEVSRAALFQNRSSNSTNAEAFTALTMKILKLPGGGRLLVGIRQRDLIPISPIAVGHTRFRITAIAFDENQ